MGRYANLAVSSVSPDEAGGMFGMHSHVHPDYALGAVLPARPGLIIQKRLLDSSRSLDHRLINGRDVRYKGGRRAGQY